MIVHKVLNNNIVSSLDECGREVLLVGRGLGWQMKPGQGIDKSKIEKVFRMDDIDTTERLKQLLLEVDVNVIKTATRIIEYARSILKKKLNKNVYITLTDHISFAIERVQQGIVFGNALQWETQKLYPAEFAIGTYALKQIEEQLHVALPADEAASIALHLINAEYDCDMQDTVQMTTIIQSSLNIVRYSFNTEFDENSLDYQRFVTHLVFFAQRVLRGKIMAGDPDELHEIMRRKYPQQFKCAVQIGQLVEKQYDAKLGAEEITFLTVHIARVTARE